MENSEVKKIAERRVLTILQEKYGAPLPVPIHESIMKTFEAFNDVEFVDNTEFREPYNFQLDKSRFINSEKNSTCLLTITQVIEKLEKEFSPNSEEIKKYPTTTERKVWNMTEEKVFEFCNDQRIPIKERTEIIEVWNRKPDPEKEFVKRLSNRNLSLAEMQRMTRENEGLADPDKIKAKKEDRERKLKGEMDLEEKITYFFSKEGKEIDHKKTDGTEPLERPKNNEFEDKAGISDN